jgi:putative selenate reductase
MTDKLYPLTIEQLLNWILNEEKQNKVFGIYKDLFFYPKDSDCFKITRFGKQLDTPFGVAAGPHTQLTQNIITAYLTGSRFIELKTIQTLDEIEVHKPCIDMEDEGYNCEWSQELKLNQSFDQYLNAWILIHILNYKYGLSPGNGFIFNISAGYNVEGILKENVQTFLRKIDNCKDELDEKLDIISSIYPDIKKIKIPDRISDNITISTMHGCPPEEIESIAKYFISERKYHTTVKLNPTLLGKDKINYILNEKLRSKVTVPDSAFDHDLKYKDALTLIKSLKETAKANNVEFGIKLTNTLECLNIKDALPKDEKVLYMSGKFLHPISINLASILQNEFNGELNISFSAGVDCFNIMDTLSCGFNPVTVCSDILKPGGYLRQLQYISNITESLSNSGSSSIKEYIQKQPDDENVTYEKAITNNLGKYALKVLQNPYYNHFFKESDSIKTVRPLSSFDCIAAPCVDTCPDDQEIPGYMYYTSVNEFHNAWETIIRTNPFPNVTGLVCEHTCELKCTRINYDQPLAIREIKRFIAQISDNASYSIKKSENKKKIGIIGAGPSGLAAAYFLIINGYDIEVFEQNQEPGGMASAVIPLFRLSEERLKKDIERIVNLGVKIHYNKKITGDGRIDSNEIIFNDLVKEYDYIYISIGAQKSRKLNIPGEDNINVMDALEFLSRIKQNGINEFKGVENFCIIGGGNSAIDAARTAKRITQKNGEVLILYRRTINEMPADKEEIDAAQKEGIKIIELVSPLEIKNISGKVQIELIKNELKGIDNSGRLKPVPLTGSEFTITTDKIITAAGQDINPVFLNMKELKINKTSNRIEGTNIFIGGDALRGASSIISAIADGRKAAEEIIKFVEYLPDNKTNQNDPFITPFEHQKKSSIRQFRQISHENILPDFLDFEMRDESIKKDDAIKEAARCLMCNELCNVCVSVCPNRANISYESKLINKKIPDFIISENKLAILNLRNLEITQKYQVLNIGDLCNECGNCATFCPTSGKPYKDKPRIYLSEKSYQEGKDGYFYSDIKKTIFSNRGNYNESLQILNDSIIYENDYIMLNLAETDFKILNYKIKNNSTEKVLTGNLAEMYVLLINYPEFLKNL